MCPSPGGSERGGDPQPRALPLRGDGAEPGPVPGDGPRRDRLEPAGGALQVDVQGLARPAQRARPQSQPRRAGDGGALRASLPGLAGGLSAHRPARLLLVLRGLHPHRRFDVQPARQVAGGLQQHRLARADRLAQLSAHQPRLAAGPQRLLAPGSRLHRPRRQQAGGGGADLPAAGRQHPAVDHRSLPEEPELCEPHHLRQGAGVAVAGRRGRRRPLRRRRRAVGLGQRGRASPT